MAATLKADPTIAQAWEEIDAAWPGQCTAEWTPAGLAVDMPWLRHDGTTMQVLVYAEGFSPVVRDMGETTWRPDASGAMWSDDVIGVCGETGCDWVGGYLQCAAEGDVAANEALLRVCRASAKLLAADTELDPAESADPVEPMVAAAWAELDSEWGGLLTGASHVWGVCVSTPWKRIGGKVTVLLTLQDGRVVVCDNGLTAMTLAMTDPNGDYVHFGSRRNAAASVCAAVGCDLGQSDISCEVGDGVSVGEAVMRVSHAAVQLLALDPRAVRTTPADAVSGAADS